MITEYHVQLILNKMDELRADIKELINLFTSDDKTIQQTTTPLEVNMNEEQKTPESVTITEQGASTAEANPVPETHEAVADKTAVQGAEHGKSKTATFKAYRAVGGKLSWKKWQDAGMPEKPEDAQV